METDPNKISEQPEPLASGTPVEASDGQQEQLQPQEPVQKESLTLEDVRRIAREVALQTSQSLTDKAEQRILKNLEVLKGANVQVTPQQEQALRATITKEVMEEAKTGGSSPQPGPASGGHPLVQWAEQRMAKVGIVLEDGDPELKEVDFEADVDEFKITLDRALSKKKARVASQAEKANLRTPGGGGDGTPSNLNKTATEIWDEVS